MLKLEHITKKYGETTILEDASYTFPSRGVVCLLGASGSGKTTLLNMLAGFDSNYQGSVSSCGNRLSDFDADARCAYRRDNVGFVFQNYQLLPGRSVLENALTAAELSEDSEAVCQQRAQQLLERLGLAEKANQAVETLSGGQKQRVAIARALLNNPQIILADEPTGALDRKTSNEIMELLQEFAAERLVIVITHDAKLCEFADTVIRIEDKKIVEERSSMSSEIVQSDEGMHKPVMTGQPQPQKRAKRNFSCHWKRYLTVAMALAFGMLAVLFSFSFENVMDREILAFQEKNTVFNNGYIKGTDDGTILQILQKDERLENVYYQYKLSDITLSANGHSEQLAEKFPLPKTTESLSYGVMPRRGVQEVALTPSLAKKFSADIKELLGKSVTLTVQGKDYPLTVSGIYNASYDDFFVSSDVEQQFYAELPPQENYSISYDVIHFADIVAVSNALELQGIHGQNASREVYALQKSFRSLERLFQIISALLLFLAVFLCAVLLVKLQNSRYREIGLLSALGFPTNYLQRMIRWENVLLAGFSAGITMLLLVVAVLVCSVVDFPLQVGVIEFLTCVSGTFVMVIGISTMASARLIHTEPAEALRHQ